MNILCFGGPANGQFYSDPVAERRKSWRCRIRAKFSCLPPPSPQMIAEFWCEYSLRRGTIEGERTRPFWVMEGTDFDDYQALSEGSWGHVPKGRKTLCLPGGQQVGTRTTK